MKITNPRQQLFNIIDGKYQLNPPYRVVIPRRLLFRLFKNYNPKKERGGLIICDFPFQGSDFIANKMIPIANESHCPSKEYKPREERFHRLMEKYLEDPNLELPILYHTHPVASRLDTSMLKLWESLQNIEPSKQDFSPFPIWSSKFKTEFDYPQLLFSKSMTGLHCIWIFGAGTNIPFESLYTSSIGGKNLINLTEWLKNAIWPLIHAFWSTDLKNKILTGLGVGSSLMVAYQLFKKYPATILKALNTYSTPIFSASSGKR